MCKRILLVSELFYPANRIGALRPSKLAKYLLFKGYKVDIVTREEPSGFYLHPNCNFFTIQNDKNITSVEKKHTPPSAIRKFRSAIALKIPLINDLRRLKRTLCSLLDSVKYKRKVDTLFADQSIVPASYHACITSFGPFSSVLIGLSLKRRYKVKKWICDFRDPIVVEDSSRILRPFLLHLQNMCLQHADEAITVSAGCVQLLLKDSKPRSISVIPNGYDREDVPEDFCEKKLSIAFKRSNTFSCTYVGSLYEGKRTLRPFFQTLASLIKSGDIDLNKITFHYAGYDGDIVMTEASDLGLSEIVYDHGFLSREDCLKLQFQSDLLLLSTWNTRKAKGVLTGKFLEYLLICKPICAIVMGECPGSEVAEIIAEGKLGVTYEEANHVSDFNKLKDYLLTLYSSHINGTLFNFHPNREVVEKYDYRNLIELYVKVIEG